MNTVMAQLRTYAYNITCQNDNVLLATAFHTIFTVWRYALHGLSYRNSVRLSVRLSVTLMHCVHMVRPRIVIFSPYGSPIILVSGVSRPSQNSKGVTPSKGVEWGWGGYELAIFDQ